MVCARCPIITKFLSAKDRVYAGWIKLVRVPGFEPGLVAWEATVMPD